MHSKTKFFLWLGGGLFAAGLLLCGVIFALGGFDIMNVVSTESYIPRTETVSPADLKALRLDVQNQPVVLQLTSGTEVQVHYLEFESDTYAVTNENGVFTLTHRQSISSFISIFRGIFNGLSRIHQKVVVEVPASFAADLDIQTSNASVKADSLPKLSAARFATTNGSMTLSRLQIAELTASTSNSSIRLEYVTGGRASVTSTNGSMTLKDVQLTGDLVGRTSNASLTAERLDAANVDLRSTNGRLSIRDAKAAGRIQGETTSGSISAERVNAAQAQLTTRNGSLTLNDAVLSETVTARTTNSSVRVDRLDCPDIRLESSNGSVKGSILGRQSEFSIVTTTTNGSASPSSVINQQAKKQLNANSTNGSIKLEFVG